MLKTLLSFLILIYFYHLQNLVAQSGMDNGFNKEEFSYENQRIIPCATPDPTVDQIIASKAEVDQWLIHNGNRNRNQVIVYVIF